MPGQLDNPFEFASLEYRLEILRCLRLSSIRIFSAIPATWRPLPLLHFALHQRSDSSLNFECLADELDEQALRQSLD